MTNLRAIGFSLLLPSLSLGVACQKSSSFDSPNPSEQPPAPVSTGGSEVPETPLTGPNASPANPTPLTPEPVQPTTPGSPDNPAPVSPTTPGVTPSTEPVVVTPPPEPVPPPTEFKIKESQFWVYSKEDEALVFNNPWDDVEGDAIIRDEGLVPGYARRCLEAAQAQYNSIAVHPDFKAKVEPLLAKGVTPDLTFLVVVSDSPADRTALRRLDRDAYFWHWTDPAKKPVLAMNQYEKGSWVWEVLATPKSCVQPVVKDIGRMFDWTARRLVEKEGNK